MRLRLFWSFPIFNLFNKYSKFDTSKSMSYQGYYFSSVLLSKFYLNFISIYNMYVLLPVLKSWAFYIFRQELPLNSKAQLLRPIRGRFVNASAVALLSFLYLLNLTQVSKELFFFYFHFSSAIETVAASEADLVDLYPFNGGYSVMGVDAESAVGLLGLLLFIDLMRVHFVSHLYQKY